MLFVSCIVDNHFTTLNQENAQRSSLVIYSVSTFVKNVGCPGDTVHEELFHVNTQLFYKKLSTLYFFNSSTLCIKC
jgi:hypothetical protein